MTAVHTDDVDTIALRPETPEQFVELPEKNLNFDSSESSNDTNIAALVGIPAYFRESQIPPSELNQETLFRELVAQHQKRLYRFVIKYIDHPDDAADITQQAFVEAARTIASFRGDSKLSTWLFGIAMNMVRNYVRVALKRHISFRHSSGQNILPAYLLAPAVEDTVRGAVRQTSGGSYLALDPGISRKLLENIKSTVGDLSRSMQRPVLLTSMDIRRYLRKMIEQDLYELPVLSYQELTQEINIQPLARVEL